MGKNSQQIEGEESQCKYEDFDRIESNQDEDESLTNSVQMIKEEALVEEEDSKNSDLVQ